MIRTRLRAIQNLPLQGSLKRLSQLYSRNRWTYKTHFFFHFSMFTFLLITKEPRKLEIFFRNIGIFILFWMLPIGFRYIYPFSRNNNLKKRLKNFNLKYLWNWWINPFAQRTVSIGILNLPLQRISKRLSQFYSSYATTKKITFFYKLFFFSKNNE